MVRDFETMGRIILGLLDFVQRMTQVHGREGSFQGERLSQGRGDLLYTGHSVSLTRCFGGDILWCKGGRFVRYFLFYFTIAIY